jgi:ubiquinone/menaquinone biosynthesis C-methylase UbiE
MERTHWVEVGEDLGLFSQNSAWREHADAVNRAALVRWLPPARWDRVLKTDTFDEAVGQGICSLLSSYATSVVAVECSFSILRQARQSHRLPTVVCGDVRRLPLAGGTIEAIVSLSTLDHFRSLDDVRVSLREMHRILQPGGQLLITMDNLANPLIWLRNRLPSVLLRRSGIVPYYVGATCGPGGLSRLLEQAGFRVVNLHAIMHCPRLVVLPLCRLLSHRAGFLRRPFLRLLMALEILGRWPSSWLTGHFIVALAAKEDA